ncbi:uncharacterized protein LOC141602615 [Silene latifolia]|uniref:uncharacterized protein LOC141602615 n=1 Tax=Silene latifolia TaxID=37657 RepID=UPI003D777792
MNHLLPKIVISTIISLFLQSMADEASMADETSIVSSSMEHETSKEHETLMETETFTSDSMVLERQIDITSPCQGTKDAWVEAKMHCPKGKTKKGERFTRKRGLIYIQTSRARGKLKAARTRARKRAENIAEKVGDRVGVVTPTSHVGFAKF